jgi:hypothetical protein
MLAADGVSITLRCIHCGERMVMAPLEARTMGKNLIEGARQADEDMAAEMRRRLDQGMKP